MGGGRLFSLQQEMFFRNVAGNGAGHTSRAGPHDHSGSRDADTTGLFTSEVG